jgi:hypothetical protein
VSRYKKEKDPSLNSLEKKRSILADKFRKEKKEIKKLRLSILNKLIMQERLVADAGLTLDQRIVKVRKEHPGIEIKRH